MILHCVEAKARLQYDGICICFLSRGEAALLYAGGIVIYDSLFTNIAVGAGFGFLTITEGELMRNLLLLHMPGPHDILLNSHVQQIV